MSKPQLITWLGGLSERAIRFGVVRIISDSRSATRFFASAMDGAVERYCQLGRCRMMTYGALEGDRDFLTPRPTCPSYSPTSEPLLPNDPPPLLPFSILLDSADIPPAVALVDKSPFEVSREGTALDRLVWTRKKRRTSHRNESLSAN
jgi:hypothetical protein